MSMLEYDVKKIAIDIITFVTNRLPDKLLHNSGADGGPYVRALVTSYKDENRRKGKITAEAYHHITLGTIAQISFEQDLLAVQKLRFGKALLTRSLNLIKADDELGLTTRLLLKAWADEIMEQAKVDQQVHGD
jgi:hypothetical protein